MTHDLKTFALFFVLTAVAGAVVFSGCGGSQFGSPSETGSQEEQSIDQLQKQPTDSTVNGPLTPETRARTQPVDPQHTPRVTNLVNSDLDDAEDEDTLPCNDSADEPCLGEDCSPCAQKPK